MPRVAYTTSTTTTTTTTTVTLITFTMYTPVLDHQQQLISLSLIGFINPPMCITTIISTGTSITSVTFSTIFQSPNTMSPTSILC
ncbi:hypothetical protein E2C01_011429 [Portunus trituberculatus]|uniref:Uncharacterized protein n=1 Tax=Portunus trituberculatus TaxID=210409 RepID=A0A5B7DB58_PORTR|nr:hypothetical protein [Portunus trituberculatus]